MDSEAIEKYRYINTQDKLSEAVDELKNTSAIAVDLEADSMFHYREKVCLIQIATENESYVIDPLVIDDISELKPVFEEESVKKILHGADYDVRSLHRDYSFSIKNLFDTELACRFLGESHTGLGAILKKRFGVKLNKKYQKKDWSQRPLPEGMMEYGVKDVNFLIPLCKELEGELEDKGRKEWIIEECEILSKVRVNQNSKEHLFMNIKGAGKLGSRSLCLLESLCEMRIRYAELKDKPLFKVISNEALISLAVRRPVTKNHMKKLHILSAKQIAVFGDDIIKVIKNGMKISKEDLPRYPKKKPPTVNPEVPSRIRKLKIWREKKADLLKLDPSLIMNKALMYNVASLNPAKVELLDSIENMRNWQKNEFGEEIVKILNSKGSSHGKKNQI